MVFTTVEKTAVDKPTHVGSELSLQISLLGEFSLRYKTTAVTLNTSTHQELLAYLVVNAHQTHARQQLSFLFWPDSNEAQARTNLRKALHIMRQTLPEADCFLSVDRQTVQWRLDAPCVVDVWEFETAVNQAQQTNTLTAQQTVLEQVINAYHGDFLPGHYDDWVLSVREKLRQQYLSSIEKLLGLYENQRQYPAAISLAQKLLREDPLHEAAYRRLMCLQALDGNVASALRTYHVCSTRLQRELGVTPSQATQETYERLLQVPTSPTPPSPARLPLVARKQAWQTLQTRWKQNKHGQPSVVLLDGEAGIGKTRLAEELLEWTERQGFVALTAVCYPSEKQLAYAPVATWLRSEQMQPVLRRLDKRCLEECSRLLPELQRQFPDLPLPTPLNESWQRQHFFSAIAQTLLQLRQPFLLFVDDLQWCDQDTLDWLHFLLYFESRSRFLLLGAVRSEEITPDHRLIPWQQQLERDGRFTRITLKRLNATASGQLAGHVLQKELDDQQTARLYTETEGNPLFVVEMARASFTAQAPSTQLSTLPPKVQSVIETRLTSLSQPAYELAQLAAVIGRSFTFDLLNHACIHSEDALIRSLDELWQRRIVRERDSEAYDFSHDKIRQGAYAPLSRARRRQLHQQVGRALQTVHAHDLDAVSGQIAGHCEAAGQFQEAIVYYHRAARMAQAVYANKDALAYLQRAIDLFSQAAANPQQQVEIYEQLGDVLVIIGRYEEAEGALETAVSLATNILQLSRLHRKLSRLWLLQWQAERATQALHKAAIVLGDKPSVAEPAWWQEWLQMQLDRLWLYYWTNQNQQMAQLAQEVRPFVDKHGSPMQRGLFFQRLVLLSFRQDRYVLPQETVNHAHASLSALEESGDAQQIAFARFVLAFTYLWHGRRGDLDNAETHMQAALTQAEQIGDIVVQCRCLSYLPLIYRKMSHINKVRDLMPRALAVAKQCQMPEYIANASGNLAWIAWCDGDLAEAQQQGNAALAAIQKLPMGTPLKWIGLWPLLGVSVVNNETAVAAKHAQILLEPSQQRLPDEITAVLQAAIASWENNQPETARTNLKQALELAQTYQYL